jgi:dihydrofolate reductase
LISIIVAQAQNGVIGSENDLPWHLPDDLKRFKKFTTNNCVIMGANTYKSILNRLGKPLPDRFNIVLSRSKIFKEKGVFSAPSMDAALKKAEELDCEIFVIGGEQVYKDAIKFADRIYLTKINSTISGDRIFPDLNPQNWAELHREYHKKDKKHAFSFEWITLERR